MWVSKCKSKSQSYIRKSQNSSELVIDRPAPSNNQATSVGISKWSQFKFSNDTSTLNFECECFFFNLNSQLRLQIPLLISKSKNPTDIASTASAASARLATSAPRRANRRARSRRRRRSPNYGMSISGQFLWFRTIDVVLIIKNQWILRECADSPIFRLLISSWVW